jgi:hypothetical protein
LNFCVFLEYYPDFYELTTENEGLRETDNENGVRVVSFATSETIYEEDNHSYDRCNAL